MRRPCSAAHLDPNATWETCTACRLFLTNQAYYLRWGGDPKLWNQPQTEELSFVMSVTTAEQILPRPKPGLLRKALNFGQALLSHVVTGGKHVTKEQQEARLAICRSCVGVGGYYDEAKDTCQHPKCGCLMKRKSSWKGSKCPIKKW